MGGKAVTEAVGCGDGPLEIRLLGELEVLHRGARITLPSSKRTRALLSYLVVTGRPHLRDRLCELLWPDPHDPRAALRWSLTKLRDLVDLEEITRIQADRERVGFEPRGASVDLTRARSALRDGTASASTSALQNACSLFRGELLDGLDLPDCYQFHEWCVAEREAARTLRVSIHAELVRRLSATPSTREDALKLARVLVSIDPLSEEAHTAVVRLLTDLGRRREAIAQSDTCRRILERELGRKPGVALLLARSRARVEEARDPLQAVPSPTPAPPPGSPCRPAPVRCSGSEVALVGRDGERAKLALAVAEARSARTRQVLLITGEAGMGKTRLLEELATDVRAMGGVTLSGRAFESEQARPYGVWIDVLRSTSAKEATGHPALRGDLTALLPELGAAPNAVDRNRLFDAVRGALERVSHAAPVVCVVIDDVHWLDDASAAVLHFVARGAEACPLILACGARAEELRENEPSARLFHALARDGGLTRIDLSPLDGEDIVKLASGIAPSIDASVVAKESAGNPFFAIEIAHAVARGTGTTSEPLSGLIADRLRRLRDEAREALPWAAAIGHCVEPSFLERVTGMTPAAVVALLEELEQRGILRSSGESYDFVHDLVREAAYRALSGPRKRAVHVQIARALREGGSADAVAGDVAHHASLGGDHDLAARAYLAAAERCLRLVAYEEAARLAQCGIQHTSPLPGATRIALHIELLRVYVVSGKWLARAAEVKGVLTRLIQEGLAARLDRAQMANGLYLLSVVARERGDLDAAHDASLRAADAVRGADPRATVQQLAGTARCLALIERDMGVAVALLEEADALAASANVNDVIDLDWGHGLALAFAGRYPEARERLSAVLVAGRRGQDHYVECECLLQLTMMDLEDGQPERALARCEELAPVVAEIGEGTERPAAAVLGALARRARGDPGAGTMVDAAIFQLREVDAKGLLAYALNLAAGQDLARGDRSMAGRRAEEALQAALIVKRASQAVIARGLLARVAVDAGDRAGAREHLDAITADLAVPHGVSGRARAFIALVEQSVADSNAG